MRKWYEITLTTITVFAVEVEDEPEAGNPEEIAQGYALNEFSFLSGETEVTECRLLKDSEVESAKRNADEVSKCAD